MEQRFNCRCLVVIKAEQSRKLDERLKVEKNSNPYSINKETIAKQMFNYFGLMFNYFELPKKHVQNWMGLGMNFDVMVSAASEFLAFLYRFLFRCLLLLEIL